MSPLFGEYLVENGLATPEDIVRALNRQRDLQAPLGTVALKYRYLSMKQVFVILNAHAETAKRFGDIAVEFGFLTRDQLQELLVLQVRERPMLGKLLVEMGVIDEHSMNSHHDIFVRTSSPAPCRPRSEESSSFS